MTPKGGNTKQTLQDRSHDVWLCACSHGRVQRCALLVASTTHIECNLLGHHGSHDSNLHSICVPLLFTFFQGPPLHTHPFNRSKKQHLLPLRGTSLSCHGRFRLATVSRTEANTVGLSRSGSSVRSITGAYRALIELLRFARQGVITLLEM